MVSCRAQIDVSLKGLRNSRRLTELSAIAVYLALTGCATLRSMELNLVSTAEEVKIGQQLSVEIEKQEKVLDDRAVQVYVREIGGRLARLAPRQDVQYTVTVIDAPDKVNAFALPGGYMYVYTGLMRICDNEAELAAVMAHETGHVSCHHHGESMTRQFGYNIIMSIVLGENPHALAQLGSQLMGTAGAMFYSRENEREADRVGIELLVEAGYNPRAMLSFMGKLLEEDRKRGGGRGLPIFASHPPTEERIARLETLAERYPQEVRDSNTFFAERYRRQVLERLRD